ncbi:hypothetical protein D9758_017553 [Tetrapyrgos nigripes]|uniref:Uncharacterized protein n=1 Tax=Tetrapyrgos nigripes TaxID=182062 RepID=A0A8H5C6L8_9AGAR|nr:hypothetical protein D9758_017553 [Tetrapyrgos nigripes]
MWYKPPSVDYIQKLLHYLNMLQPLTQQSLPDIPPLLLPPLRTASTNVSSTDTHCPSLKRVKSNANIDEYFSQPRSGRTTCGKAVVGESPGDKSTPSAGLVPTLTSTPAHKRTKPRPSPPPTKSQNETLTKIKTVDGDAEDISAALSESLFAEPQTVSRASIAAARLLRLQQEQEKDDNDAFGMSEAQYRNLVSSFSTVKFEFFDLDGLVWTGSALKRANDTAAAAKRRRGSSGTGVGTVSEDKENVDVNESPLRFKRPKQKNEDEGTRFLIVDEDIEGEDGDGEYRGEEDKNQTIRASVSPFTVEALAMLTRPPRSRYRDKSSECATAPVTASTNAKNDTFITTPITTADASATARTRTTRRTRPMGPADVNDFFFPGCNADAGLDSASVSHSSSSFSSSPHPNSKSASALAEVASEAKASIKTDAATSVPRITTPAETKPEAESICRGRPRRTRSQSIMDGGVCGEFVRSRSRSLSRTRDISDSVADGWVGGEEGDGLADADAITIPCKSFLDDSDSDSSVSQPGPGTTGTIRASTFQCRPNAFAVSTRRVSESQSDTALKLDPQEEVEKVKKAAAQDPPPRPPRAPQRLHVQPRHGQDDDRPRPSLTNCKITTMTTPASTAAGEPLSAPPVSLRRSPPKRSKGLVKPKRIRTPLSPTQSHTKSNSKCDASVGPESTSNSAMAKGLEIPRSKAGKGKGSDRRDRDPFATCGRSFRQMMEVEDWSDDYEGYGDLTAGLYPDVVSAYLL